MGYIGLTLFGRELTFAVLQQLYVCVCVDSTIFVGYMERKKAQLYSITGCVDDLPKSHEQNKQWTTNNTFLFA